MTTRYYRFAGMTVAMSMDADCFFEKEYRLAHFTAEPSDDSLHLVFEKKKELQPPCGRLVCSTSAIHVYSDEDTDIRYMGCGLDTWEDALIRTQWHGKSVNVQVCETKIPGKISATLALDALSVEHLLARNDGFVFHCSCIDHEGKAILFTAPSQTGKSTQAELWNKYRGSEIINGDRIAIRLVNGVLMAEGIPFAGSSQYCKNRSLPIEAIVYLAQAHDTSIRKLRGYEAFSRIWEGISVNVWDKEDMERVSHVVQKAAELPVFYLSCTPDESAVVALHEILAKQVNL